MNNTSKTQIGETFSRLTITERAKTFPDGSIGWNCRCECGNFVIVPTFKLRNGHTKSCGCLSKDLAQQRFTTHGESNSRLFKIWSGMKNRCTNPKNASWKHYGERSITVCPDWIKDYSIFATWARLNGYEEHLTLERKEVNKGYSPENCCWITKAQQALNKTDTLRLPDGSSATALSESLGISKELVYTRIKSGMSIEAAATSPKQRVRHVLPDGRFASDVAEENGISKGTFNVRVASYGWTPEKACTVPVRPITRN